MDMKISGQRWAFSAGCLCLILALSISYPPGSLKRAALAAPSITFLVDTNSETNDATPGDNVCANSGGDCSLRAAVQEANALAPADIITLPAGTYHLTMKLDVTHDLTINGAGRTTTIIDGAGSAGAWGFQVSPDYDLALNNLTLRNFPKALIIYTGDETNHGEVSLSGCNLRDNLNTDASNPGSAVANYCDGCTVNLSNTKVYNNSSPACGAFENQGTLNIESGSSIYENDATFGVGGAICNEGGELGITLASIYDNTASGASNNYGGAVYQSNGGTGIYQGQIYNNSADELGGGIYIAAGTFSLQSSTVSGNDAPSGGGLYLNVVTASIDLANIAANEANYGAGIYSSGALTITNSAIISNTATSNGGGVRVQAGTTTLLNSTVSGNQADGNGAGLLVNSTGVLKLGSVTIRNNTANADDNGDGAGGGVYNGSGSLSIKNSIIAGNEDLTASIFEVYDPDCVGTLTSEGYNLIGKVNSISCQVSGNLTGVMQGSLSPGIERRARIPDPERVLDLPPPGALRPGS